MDTLYSQPWHAPLTDAVISSGYRSEYGTDITPDLLERFKEGEEIFHLSGKTFSEVEQNLDEAIASASPEQLEKWSKVGGAQQAVDMDELIEMLFNDKEDGDDR